MLIDTAEIKLKAGNGGKGHVSFRRERFIAKGGPDGGDGGKGGHVYLVADHNLATLVDFRTRPFYNAVNGQEGGKKKMTGAGGDDLIIKVPAGTLVYELRSNEEQILVGDLVDDRQQLLICRGGTGGKGNDSFKSSTNQVPRQYTLGGEGEEKQIKLEIKIIADVGLVGVPNAGKSTLVNQLTASRAKVASYPFTTLSPNLGVCRLNSEESVVIADIPGLIEGASEGKGLGDEFLRHVERTRLLVHLIDPFGDGGTDLAENSIKACKTIRKELADYSEELAQKKEIIVINKIDITEVRESFEKIRQRFAQEGIEVLGISAVTGEGVSVGNDGLGSVEGASNLREVLMRVLPTLPSQKVFDTEPVVKTYNLRNLPNRRMVFGGGSVVKGDFK